MTTTTFKGARYITKFASPIEWDNANAYEAIEAVQHDGFTYLSKQPVPAGVQIDNEDFWLLWADPNAQMEQLRQEMNDINSDVISLNDWINNGGSLYNENIDNAFNANNALTAGSYAFTLNTAIKAHWIDASDNEYFYLNYAETLPQNRELILPLHKSIFENENTLAIMTVQKMENVVFQTLVIPKYGCEFSRYYQNGKFSNWEYVNANIIPNGADAETMNAIIGCAKTYIEAPTTYRHYGANWYSTTINDVSFPTNVGSEYEGLDCSGFVEMLMYGCPYNTSRFIESANLNGYVGYNFDIYNGNNSLRQKNNLAFTNCKAEWFRDNGFGFEPNADLSNLKPGDIFFWGDETNYPNRWKGIYHCGIVIGANYGISGNVSNILTLEVSGGDGTEYAAQVYNRGISGGMDKTVYVARIPYGFMSKYKNLPITHVLPIACPYTGSTGANALQVPFENYEMFCVEFDGLLENADSRFTISIKDSDSSLIAASLTHAIDSSLENVYQHYKLMLPTHRATGNIDGITAIQISGGANSRVRNAKVYNSYIPEYDITPYYKIGSTSGFLDFITDIIAISNSKNIVLHTVASLDYFSYAGDWEGEININPNNGNGNVTFKYVNNSDGNMKIVVIAIESNIATSINSYNYSAD